MEQYIKKSALVAEIDKGINGRNDWQFDDYRKGYHDALIMLKKYLSAFEVKEVDLDEEVTNQIRLLNGVHTLYDGKQWWKGTYNELSYFAKHFFELGLKTQHGNIDFQNLDDLLEEEGVDPISKDAKMFKKSYYMALEKLKEKIV